MEADAVNTFEEVFKERHQNVKVQQCGLFLSKNHPFIGGSPDRIIECSCCGKSCLEVKCPFSIRHTTPTDPNIKLHFLNNGPSRFECLSITWDRTDLNVAQITFPLPSGVVTALQCK